MKYVFIINPKAGHGAFQASLCTAIDRIYDGQSYDVKVTRGPGHATDLVRGYETDGPMCFVSCGGDGTLAEVVSGLMQRSEIGVAGHKRPYLTCLPYGSGNDFIRVFEKNAGDWTPEVLLSAHPMLIDIYRCNNHFGLNICNFGFDARVAARVSRYKKWRGVSGTTAYNISVAATLLHPLAQRMYLKVDGKSLPPEILLLGVAANGTSYGGGFVPAPMARVNDGLLNLVFVRKLSRLRFSRFIGSYRRGLHLTEPGLHRYIVHMEARRVELNSEDPIAVCVDGGVEFSRRLDIEVIPSALTFLIPN